MFELLTTLEDSMVISFRVDSDGDYLVTQFEESDELDAFLASADDFHWEEACQVFHFGEVRLYMEQDVGEDE